MQRRLLSRSSMRLEQLLRLSIASAWVNKD
jgi:hypothetical protein